MSRLVFTLFSVWTALFLPAIACSRSNNKKNVPAENPAAVQPLPADSGRTHTYLALGDSYTIASAINVSGSYPVQTVKNLNALGLSFADPEIIATNGWTTTNLLNDLGIDNPDTSFDIVTLLIGVNNQYQGGTLANYQDEFSRLLDKSIAYAGNRPDHVVVLSIPDYSVTPFGITQNRSGVAGEIDAFNQMNKTIALAKGAGYLNVTDHTRAIGAGKTLIAADGLHYSADEYSLWAVDLAKLIRSVLSR